MEGYRGPSDSSKAVAEYDGQKQLMSPFTPDTEYAWSQLHCYLDFFASVPQGYGISCCWFSNGSTLIFHHWGGGGRLTQV